MNNSEPASDLNRRDFLGGSIASLAALLGSAAARAQEKDAPASDEPPKRAVGPTIKCGVIGCGPWGREILKSLSRLPNAPVVALADTYPAFLRRAGDSAPNAKKYEDYKQVLADAEVQAVIIATPSHAHREIAIAALKAGKHVYCEAPLAHTIEDAKAIAQAAKAAGKVHFQAGLQNRSDPELLNLATFVRSGSMGKPAMVRSQRHKKESWRRAAPTAEREEAINWRLRKETSPGLVGEIGIHHADLASWFLGARAAAVTGFGSIQHWRDGRTTHDTVQAIFEFPDGLLHSFDGTLANSFEGEYDIFYGTDSAIMIRDRRSWMFKEVDSPLLGWEVYARKEEFYRETGIVLAANATKLAAQGDNPVLNSAASADTALYYALEAFIANSGVVGTGVADFISSFGADDEAALKEYLADLQKSKLPYAGFQEGYEATVLALKGHEATVTGQRIVLKDEWFLL